MAKFTKSTTMKGIFKGVTFTDDGIVDTETGEPINFHDKCREIFGDDNVDINVACKEDVDLDE